MTNHPVVPQAEWESARIELLKKEKEFTRLGDELARQRRELPWTKIDKAYLFDAPGGTRSLADLFGDCSQLIVYHFMFDPEWTEGCKSCSLIADHYNPAVVHLHQRDVSLVTISRAPLEKLLAFERRMGWTFQWASSFGNDFNRDFHVSFTDEELKSGAAAYNYGVQAFPVREAPGMSVFFKDKQGSVFHTYSTFARGLDTFLGAYHLLEIVPKGRDEAGFTYPMEWVRHHDRYGDKTFVDPYVKLILDMSAKS
jgi:predicted dithiol-disulfide oxidoreductase (DUF899 family)